MGILVALSLSGSVTQIWPDYFLFIKKKKKTHQRVHTMRRSAWTVWLNLKYKKEREEAERNQKRKREKAYWVKKVACLSVIAATGVLRVQFEHVLGTGLVRSRKCPLGQCVSVGGCAVCLRSQSDTRAGAERRHSGVGLSHCLIIKNLLKKVSIHKTIRISSFSFPSVLSGITPLLWITLLWHYEEAIETFWDTVRMFGILLFFVVLQFIMSVFILCKI